MLSGLRSARRRRGRNNRAARIAIPVAAVMALGVTVGIVVGASGHSTPKLHSAASSGSAGVSSTAVEDTCDIIVPAHPLTAKGLATPYTTILRESFVIPALRLVTLVRNRSAVAAWCV